LQLIEDVEQELELRVSKTKHSERVRTALTGVQSAAVLVDSIEQGLDVVNAYAAEHLEIQTVNARRDAAAIRNAGAVFIGRFSPVSLGDYSAGSNHVLPTGGCACHSSGLSVQTFLKGLHYIEYEKSAFVDIAQTVITLANAEDLPAHGEAISVRLEAL
jgi:histidinol dehydrogenase